MDSHNGLSNDVSRRLSRRTLLRSALVGGSGLLAAYAVGCGGDDEAAGTPSPGTPVTTSPPDRTPAATLEPSPGTPAPGVMRWQRLDTTGTVPASRRDYALVTDGRRVLLFGGRGEREYDDLWSFDVESRRWEEVAASGGPSMRFGANASYDPARNAMLLFGGQSGPSFFDETWAFDFASEQWTLLDVGSAPAQRYGSASALDPAGRLTISHGFTNAGRFDDTWRLQGASWSDVSPEADRPLERCLVRGAWDSAGDRFLMFGGQSDLDPFLNDMWEFRDGEGWRELTAGTRPPGRHFYAMALEGESRRLVLFGGSTLDGPVGDTWLFDAASDTWTAASPEGESPSPRFGHDMVWLPERGSMLIFGGRERTQDLDDTWELVLGA